MQMVTEYKELATFFYKRPDSKYFWLMVDSQGWSRLPLECFFQIPPHPLSILTVSSIIQGPCHHSCSVLLTCLFFLYSFLITLLMNLYYSNGKESACNSADPGLIPGSGRSPGSPVFLPGESHGQRGLVGHSPQFCKELDMTD